MLKLSSISNGIPQKKKKTVLDAQYATGFTCSIGKWGRAYWLSSECNLVMGIALLNRVKLNVQIEIGQCRPQIDELCVSSIKTLYWLAQLWACIGQSVTAHLSCAALQVNAFSIKGQGRMHHWADYVEGDYEANQKIGTSGRCFVIVIVFFLAHFLQKDARPKKHYTIWL